MVKNQVVDLVSPQSGALDRIVMWMGWESPPTDKIIDLDAAVIAFDPFQRVESIVSYKHRENYHGALRHAGDTKGTAAGGEFAERIDVQLSGLPPQVVSLVFTISSFRGQTFTDITRAFCAMATEQGEQLVQFDLTDTQPSTAVLMAVIKRSANGGSDRALGGGVPRLPHGSQARRSRRTSGRTRLTVHSPWGWNPATLWAVGIAVLAVAAVIVVVRDGVDRRATREKFANLVDVEADHTVAGIVALTLTNLGEQPIFLRSVLLWTDLGVQPRDLLRDRSLVTMRWPWVIGRIQLRCEFRPVAEGFEVPSKQSRRLSVALQHADDSGRVLMSGIAFVDSEGRTFTRRLDGRVLSGERVSPRFRRRALAGEAIT